MEALTSQVLASANATAAPDDSGSVTVELEDLEPALAELQLCSRELEAARSRCLEMVDQSFDGASEIAAIVAVRLQQYRDVNNDHDPELVKKAESVEEDVVGWMPALIVIRQTVGRVSADRFLTASRLAVRAVAQHRITLGRSLGDLELILSIADDLAGANTLEARLELLASLSAEELERLRRSVIDAPTELNAELSALRDIVGRATVAEVAIAEVFDALREFVETRQLALAQFVEATDYFRELEPTKLSGRDVSVAAAKEGAKVAAEFTATKIGPKLLEQIPFVGMGIAVGDLVLEMRAKKKELEQRAGELRRLATARIARGETDEIFALARQLTADVEMLLALNVYVDVLDQLLGRLVEDTADSRELTGSPQPSDQS